MSRILAIDWDSKEVRFVLAQVGKNAVRVEKTGSAAIVFEDELSEETGLIASSEEELAATQETGGSDRTESASGNDESAQGDSAVERVKNPKVSRVERIGQTLRALLKSERIPSAKLLVGASRANVEVLQLDFPKVDEQDYPDLVRNRVLTESTTYLEGQPLDFLPLLGSGPTQRVMSVSTSRTQLSDIKTIVSPRRVARIELRAAALVEFFRDSLQTTVTDEEDDSAEPTDSFPVMLVQEVCDEVNLVVCRGGDIMYLRTFRVPPELAGMERSDRLVAEIVRTLAVAIDHPDSAPIEQIYFFDQEDVKSESDEESSDDQDTSLPASTQNDFDTTQAIQEQLARQGISLVRFNPFSSVVSEGEVERPGRFAPLLGMLLAEQEQRQPLIDLIHPRKKPTPPNYILYLVAIIFFVLCLAGYGWYWSREELASQKKEIAKLEKQRDQLASFIRNEQPLYQILNTAIQWDTAYGVVVLDELRDITLRVPKAPELIVTRLAYSGSVRGRPAFIISGKVASSAAYQRFYQNLTSDGSHTIQTAGPKKLTSGGGFSHEFSAQIFCQRRPMAAYWKNLPVSVQQISNMKPEFYDFQTSRAAGRSAQTKPQVPASGSAPGSMRTGQNVVPGTIPQRTTVPATKPQTLPTPQAKSQGK